MVSDDDDYIKQRLVRWGEWNARRESGGLGFPRECPYTRMQARSGPGISSPEIDQEAIDTERAVTELPDYLRETVRAYFVATGTVEQTARHLRVSRDTVYARIKRSLLLLSEWFQTWPRKKIKQRG